MWKEHHLEWHWNLTQGAWILSIISLSILEMCLSLLGKFVSLEEGLSLSYSIKDQELSNISPWLILEESLYVCSSLSGEIVFYLPYMLTWCLIY